MLTTRGRGLTPTFGPPPPPSLSLLQLRISFRIPQRWVSSHLDWMRLLHHRLGAKQQLTAAVQRELRSQARGTSLKTESRICAGDLLQIPVDPDEITLLAQDVVSLDSPVRNLADVNFIGIPAIHFVDRAELFQLLSGCAEFPQISRPSSIL